MADGYGMELLHYVVAAGLTPLQREAFIDHAILGRTFTQCAAEYGVSAYQVRQVCDKARQKLAAVYDVEVAA